MTKRTSRRLLVAAATVVVSVATLGFAPGARPEPAQAAGPIYQDPTQPVNARVDDLLARMSLDEKLGQLIQSEQKTTSNADLVRYRLGSMLSGGGSAPNPNTPTAWADMYDGFQRGAMSTPLQIPLIYGIDAVHGHSNVYGATIFPHNIGLGSSRDPALVERIGHATAEEMAGTGIDWNFAPCLCVARDDHWGRTYESYGEKPEIATSMASVITGLQGPTLNTPTSILATAKHYIGDGGTTGGDDQGNTAITETELRNIHLPPFREAVKRNVGSIMVSYSSWNNQKMHGNRYLITDVLKNELKFSGIVVSDWNAIEYTDGAQGFSPADVRDSMNAGIDMLMITEAYGEIIGLLRTEVQAGRVPMARIDDANRRVLTKKFELGLFEKPYADRSHLSTIGSAAHRAIAREAVQKSQVVLKNANNVLPLSKSPGKIFVAGKSADNIGLQSGGWTIEWQGKSGNITPGTTILQGIKSTVTSGTTVTYNAKGDGIDGSYKAAIAVIGELPYAEYEGDREDDLKLDSTDLAVLAKLKAAGVPVITVLVSGRPLDVSAQVNDWSGFVASWLPGTEGQGVADILFGSVKPTGTLPITWMKNAAQQPINDGDGKVGLYPYGHGLTWDVTAEPGRDARQSIRAASFSGQSGVQVEGCADEGCGESVGYVTPGDSLYYDNIDFGTSSPTTVLTRLASGASSGTIEYRLDSATGPIVGSQPVVSTGGWTTWVSRSVTLSGSATGKHRLYLTFTGAGGDFVNLNYFRFS